jgi:ribosomal protein S18 acetylase RimI-like enzyme
MPLRMLELPKDLLDISSIAAETWNYPDNPEWNVQPDEEESLADSVENYQKIWPFIRLLQFFSPGLRDFITGHIWEVDGRIAGFTQINRRGTTDTWYISAVGVHPEFRRRGIAQKLVEAVITFVRDRGGKRLLLDVIEGNVPAINLYRKLGFENFTSNLELFLKPDSAPLAPILPEGYHQESQNDYAWQPRFELMKRITPIEVRRYEPVEAGRYRKPFFTRFLFPLLKKAEGMQTNRLLIRSDSGQVIAYAIYDTHTRETGRNSIMSNLDPGHSDLASYLVTEILQKMISKDPGRMIEFNIPTWQCELVKAAEEAGFILRARLLTLGLLL